MDPIISPTWIYLAHVANAVYGLSIFALGASLFMILMLILGATELIDGINGEEERKKDQDYRTENLHCCYDFMQSYVGAGSG